MGEARSRRAKPVLAVAAVLIIIAALVLTAFLLNQAPTNPTKDSYWVLDISPSDAAFSAGYVEPNGTVHVSLNQAGITVTATATGINGFMYWRLDEETAANQSSAIFVPKQAANSHHTLEAVFVVGTPTMNPSATSEPSISGGKQEVDVLSIATEYVEANYGTDYVLNGNVTTGTYSEQGPNGTVKYEYPTASFRVPADWQQAGQIVYVMVNPQTGEIIKTFTSWSKSMPPQIPAPSGETPHYLTRPNGNESRIFLVSTSSNYGTYPFKSVPPMGSMPEVEKGDPCLIVNVTVRNDYTKEEPVGLDLYGQNSTRATIFLTAKIFNPQGAIQTTDVTPPYPGIPFLGALLSLDSGESASTTIYLATEHMDIERFEVVVEYIGVIPPP
jgi:hypothetical protein